MSAPDDDYPYEDEDGDGLCDCGSGVMWEQCDCLAGEECGRWRNGVLSASCLKAGTEECDFECPYRDRPSRAPRANPTPDLVADDESQGAP